MNNSKKLSLFKDGASGSFGLTDISPQNPHANLGSILSIEHMQTTIGGGIISAEIGPNGGSSFNRYHCCHIGDYGYTGCTGVYTGNCEDNGKDYPGGYGTQHCRGRGYYCVNQK